MHGLGLDDKGVVYVVDGAVTLVKRVTVTDETGTDRVRRAARSTRSDTSPGERPGLQRAYLPFAFVKFRPTCIVVPCVETDNTRTSLSV